MKRAFRTSIALVLAGLLAAFSAHGQTMGDYDEAPMLAEMVEAGTLPPVAERVSEEPLVREVSARSANTAARCAAGVPTPSAAGSS